MEEGERAESPGAGARTGEGKDAVCEGGAGPRATPDLF